MADFIPLECPNCGARLEVTEDLDRFACSHCGNQLMVRRGGGIVALKPVVDELKGVRAGTDKTASELAIPRLEKEIAELRALLRGGSRPSSEHSATLIKTPSWGLQCWGMRWSGS
jgi:DNA-directed RNA polymerase subunit RPC12/RpoP